MDALITKLGLADQKWYELLIISTVLFVAYNYVSYYVLCMLHKARAPISPLDFTYGFRLLLRFLDSGKKGTGPEVTTRILKETNSRTALLKVAGKDVLMTTEPENIKAILATQFTEFVLGSRRSNFGILLGDGIFTLDGAGWKHSRAMLRPQFAREQVAHVASLEPRIHKLVTHIRNANGRALDIQSLFFMLTVDSGTDFLFGESCDSLGDGLDESKCEPKSELDPELKRKFPEAFNYSQSVLRIRSLLRNLRWFGTPKDFQESKKIVHDFTNFYVQKALNASEKDIETFSRNGYVFLYELLKETRNPVVLRDQCLNILLAARDTTAGLLSFTFLELARNPDIFSKLRTSIVNSFGEGDDVDLSLITFESLKKCEYLKWVLNEALRMYPAVPRNARIATKNTTLPRGGGPDQMSPIFIKKGTAATYAVYSVHRDEEFYGKDASVFRPERWGEPLAKKLGWAYLPFNGGPRICLGQQFALTEASYITVRLLQTFKHLETFEEIYPPRLLTHLTMSAMDGVIVGMK